ncbi:MAG: hypothetical protein LBJ14_07465, partial [Desulfarculales bacterium]|nr:hypothetical protein [Desulfarculales bacterium]
ASARAEDARVVSEEEKRIDGELEPELARVRDEAIAAGRSQGEAEGFARTLGAFARTQEIRSRGQMKALDIVRGVSQKRESQSPPQNRKKAYTVDFANGDSLEVTVERLADGSMEVTDNRGDSQRIEKQDAAQIKKLSDKAVINSLYNDRGGISKYRGKPMNKSMDKPMDKGEPVLDGDGNMLFQAPHISDFYDPCVEWNMDLPENAGTNLVNANDPANRTESLGVVPGDESAVKNQVYINTGKRLENFN